MKRVFFFLCVLFCLSGCSDMGRQVQFQTANAVAQGANASLPLLLDHYRQAGAQVIEKASTRAEAEQGLEQLKTDWAPVWGAWESIRIAQDEWAYALEHKLDLQGALLGLRRAFCKLQKVWPADIRAMPLVPLACTP